MPVNNLMYVLKVFSYIPVWMIVYIFKMSLYFFCDFNSYVVSHHIEIVLLTKSVRPIELCIQFPVVQTLLRTYCLL